MTLYGLAHLLRDRAAPLWNVAEALNGRLFAIARRDGISRIPGILSARSGRFALREAVPEDARALAEKTGGEELISNYPTHQAGRLQPYEARVLYQEKE